MRLRSTATMPPLKKAVRPSKRRCRAGSHRDSNASTTRRAQCRHRPPSSPTPWRSSLPLSTTTLPTNRRYTLRGVTQRDSTCHKASSRITRHLPTTCTLVISQGTPNSNSSTGPFRTNSFITSRCCSTCSNSRPCCPSSRNSLCAPNSKSHSRTCRNLLISIGSHTTQI